MIDTEGEMANRADRLRYRILKHLARSNGRVKLKSLTEAIPASYSAISMVVRECPAWFNSQFNDEVELTSEGQIAASEMG